MKTFKEHLTEKSKWDEVHSAAHNAAKKAGHKPTSTGWNQKAGYVKVETEKHGVHRYDLKSGTYAKA